MPSAIRSAEWSRFQIWRLGGALCERYGEDPLAYLSDVLARLPALTNRDDLTPLTPAAWQPS
jgi:hypothetical protein